MNTTKFLAELQGKFVYINDGDMPGFLGKGDQVRFSFEPNGTVLSVKINYGVLSTVSGILVQGDAGECIILFNIPNHTCDGFVSCYFCFEAIKGQLSKVAWGAIDASEGYCTVEQIEQAIKTLPKLKVTPKIKGTPKSSSPDDRGTGTGHVV